MKNRGYFHFITIILIATLLMLATSACGGDQAPPETPEPSPMSGKGGGIEKVEEDVPTRPQAVSSLDKVKTATIQIEAQGTFVDPDFGLMANVAGQGSGFIFDPSGLAITNNHVVAGAALLKVWIGGERDPVNARVLGVSECFDLAVIKIEGDDFPFLEWHEGDIDVGLDVYTAGFPLGDPEFTLTRGIVSKARADGESYWSSIDYVLEHDATINPGNSGGPLVDEEGKVVGINYAAIWDANQFFAISRDQAQPIVERLSEGEDIHTIGINAIAVTDPSGTLTGIWASSVVSGSPADEAGIQPGDIITNMEGLTLAMDGTMADYCDILRTHGQENTLSIEVLRYSSGDLLTGQINGRQLAVVSVGGGPAISGVPAGAVGYGSYVTAQDDTGALMVDVPQEWSDRDGSEWYYDDAVYTLSIWAAPDIDGFTDTWTVPGMKFDVFEDVNYFGGVDGLLQTRMDSLGDYCTLYDVYSYADPLYVGQYAEYTNCGYDVGTSYVVLAAEPNDDPGAFLIRIEVQIYSERDWEAFEKIKNTFYVDSTMLGGSVPSSGGYMRITDDYGALEVEVPSHWNDIDGSYWVYDGDVIGAGVDAAPDLDGFWNTWDTPGMFFGVSDDFAELVGYVQLLDWERSAFIDVCEFNGRYDYEDALYRGKYDLFEKCGGAGGSSYMVLSAVSHTDQFSYLILLEAQIVNDEDWDHAQHVLDTFIVVGDLP